MTRPLSSEQIGAGLDRVHQERARVLAQPHTSDRAARLAALAEAEASWWEALSGHSRQRVHWRAALTAREHALQTARHWRALAQTPHPASHAEVLPVDSEAA